MPELTMLENFHQFLSGRQPTTIASYLRTIQAFIDWTLLQTHKEHFTSALLTTTAIEDYLAHLSTTGRAPRTRRKILAILTVFCRWTLAEGLLKYDPTAALSRPSVVEGAPHELTKEQRRILKMLVDQQESSRLLAIFALGYWVGLRVSEIAELQVLQCVVNQRAGEITVVDGKGLKTRTLDLPNKARLALYRYLYETSDTASDARDRASRYVFTSQRAAWLRQQAQPDHLSARGIEHLWKTLKSQASVTEWAQIKAIRFHDLRHDWAHRAREAGWSLEEIAVYAGHQTRDGMPAIATTVRYTLPGREQLKAQVQLLNRKSGQELGWLI